MKLWKHVCLYFKELWLVSSTELRVLVVLKLKRTNPVVSFSIRDKHLRFLYAWIAQIVFRYAPAKAVPSLVSESSLCKISELSIWGKSQVPIHRDSKFVHGYPVSYLHVLDEYDCTTFKSFCDSPLLCCAQSSDKCSNGSIISHGMEFNFS